MEGVFDGGACDTCFVCGLLALHQAGACPQCGGRMTYRPAVMMDEPALAALIAERSTAYRATPDREHLEALAQAVHRFAPASLALLEHPTLDELRAAYARLS
ncbi:MAG TPA: hypothetical protein VML75_15005 [Kofleriaceae bacterium]|nr:hypothetical protein [Kofleriaceae bacterium]